MERLMPELMSPFSESNAAAHGRVSATFVIRGMHLHEKSRSISQL